MYCSLLLQERDAQSQLRCPNFRHVQTPRCSRCCQQPGAVTKVAPAMGRVCHVVIAVMGAAVLHDRPPAQSHSRSTTGVPLPLL